MTGSTLAVAPAPLTASEVHSNSGREGVGWRKISNQIMGLLHKIGASTFMANPLRFLLISGTNQPHSNLLSVLIQSEVGRIL